MAPHRPRDVVIGVVENPEQSEHWPALRAFLSPAAERGGCDDLIGENELVWAVLGHSGPIAAATARLTVEKACEVVLVGGVQHERWIGPLDEAIGRAAKDAGATEMRAYGRRGWSRVLIKQGWQILGERDGVVAYERGL